jgi:error-prone DNA polymerase
MLCAADTVGMFQVESRAQMATLPRMKPARFYDLVVEVAIIRPGPIVGKMLNPYLLRRAGRQEVRYPHPSLEPILKRTLGVPLFQEQLIRMAMVASGFTGGQADELRRAMGFKRSQERMNVIEVDLRAGMAARGITGAAQEEIVQGIKSFALYGFPESHAASFALLAYASAYLKAHHPEAFLCALLNNYPMGFYHPSTLVTDAARHGVVTLPIDVARSGWRCDLERGGEDPGAAGARPAVRLGLKYVDGMREEVAKQIEQARAERPFASLGDFEARVQPNARELANLAAIGAFGPLGGTRRRALWQVEALGRSGALFRRAQAQADAEAPEDDLPGGEHGRGVDAPLPEMSPFDEMVADLRHTGINTGLHPIAYARESLRHAGVLTAAALAQVADGQRARTAGIVIVRQRPGTAKGFVFVTVEDETGFANAIVTPQRFAAHRRTILSLGAMIIEGVVQNRDGVVTIKADRFAPLPAGSGPRGRVATASSPPLPFTADPTSPTAAPENPELAARLAEHLASQLQSIDISHDFH